MFNEKNDEDKKQKTRGNYFFKSIIEENNLKQEKEKENVEGEKVFKIRKKKHRILFIFKSKRKKSLHFGNKKYNNY